MASRVTTNIVVDFGSSDDSDLFMSAEVDSRETGLNGARTSFVPGDSVGILLFKHNLLIAVDTEVTAGSITRLADGIYTVTDEIVIFTGDEEEATVKYPIDELISTKWIGVDRGSVLVNERNTVRKSTPGIGVLKISYRSYYWAYRLSSPLSVSGETVYSIVVRFVGNTE